MNTVTAIVDIGFWPVTVGVIKSHGSSTITGDDEGYPYLITGGSPSTVVVKISGGHRSTPSRLPPTDEPRNRAERRARKKHR